MASPKNKIFTFLDTNGDGTGTINATGNYAAGVENFYFESTGYAEIHRMLVHIVDTTGMSVEKYGNINGGLTNGIRLITADADLVQTCELTAQIPVKNNGEWAGMCYDANLLTWGAGNQQLAVRWTFTRSGAPIKLGPGESLRIVLNDDLTGLVEHHFMIQGQYQPQK